MKLGLQIPRFNWPGSPDNTGSKLGEIARVVDQGGFASLWVMDHFYQIAPGLGLIKQVAGLDVLSGGRAYFGIGAAWYEEEAEGMGFPFPPVATRFEMLEETLQIAHQMFKDDRSPYTGKHYQLKKPILSPQPITKPYPPIMIGGMGEKKTLKFVAQYADATNLFLRAGMDTLKHKLDVLKGHCQAFDRDYAEIEKTVLGTVEIKDDGSVQELIDLAGELEQAGFDHLIFNMPNPHEIKPLEIISEKVIPQL